jgi:uncharacterized protein YdeI (YjbR/CyaY-like superfamily)
MNQDLPIVEFKFRSELRSWLESNHNKSSGVYVRLFKKDSGIISVTFEELLDEGLCFGWSESQRLTYDDKSHDPIWPSCIKSKRFRVIFNQ